MAFAKVNGVNLYYEETGKGVPLVFVHEFAGDYRSWENQVRHFSRRYRVIIYNARGYPPSDVPEDPQAYSQDLSMEDLRGLLDHLGLDKAHIVGFSMGGSAALVFGLKYPERAHSLVIAGTGSGSTGRRADFLRDVDYVASRFESEGMEKVAEFYTRGPNRVQFEEKDPQGWKLFYEVFRSGSAKGHAYTMRGVQGTRPSIYELEEDLKKLRVPTLIMVGDEDEPCLEPGLFMKRTILSAGLVIFPKTGHTLNLEEPELFNSSLMNFLTQVESGNWRLRNPDSLSGSSVLNPKELEKAGKS